MEEGQENELHFKSFF